MRIAECGMGIAKFKTFEKKYLPMRNSASGSGSASEGLLPRKESLWLAEIAD